MVEDDDISSLLFPLITWKRGKGRRAVVLVKGRSGVFFVFFFSFVGVGRVPIGMEVGMEVYVCLRACGVVVVEYCVVSYRRNRLVPGREGVVEGCAV